jgi:hypothetical protein
MKELYDHTQLESGDVAVYGSISGFAGTWRVTKTVVLRKTATQIVMENGERFMRSTGFAFGGRSGCRLLDPQGPEVINALAEEVMKSLRYKIVGWDRDCRDTRHIDKWEILLGQLNLMAAEAQSAIWKIKKEMQA